MHQFVYSIRIQTYEYDKQGFRDLMSIEEYEFAKINRQLIKDNKEVIIYKKLYDEKTLEALRKGGRNSSKLGLWKNKNG